MSKTAFITGVTGQDGSFLTELLLAKGYVVHGTVRRTSSLERSRLQHLFRDEKIYNKSLFLHYADLEDSTALRRLMSKSAPDEIYHLAGQSHVGLSFEIPESTCETTAMGTLRLLEMIRDLPKAPRIFHATSSEMFGQPRIEPQDENTPFAPVNPYGCAKVFATQMVRVYRESFGVFACNGIMYNHESPRRGENFVTRKICRGAAAIKFGREKELLLGDLDRQRDWGDARDYVHGMWLILNHATPGDYILATGQLHSVKNVVEVAFRTVGLDWREYVKQDPRFMRTTEPSHLLGNPAKAEKVLGWKRTNTFEKLIEEMTLCEMQRIQDPKLSFESD